MKQGRVDYRSIPVFLDLDDSAACLKAQWSFPGSKVSAQVSKQDADQWVQDASNWESTMRSVRDIGPSPVTTPFFPFLKKTGENISQALFEKGDGQHDAPVVCWNQVYVQSLTQSPGGFRIVLEIQDYLADRLCRIPWETWSTKVPEKAQGIQDRLVLGKRVSLVRRILSAPKLAPASLTVSRRPLRILLFAPDPDIAETGMALDTQREITEVKKAVESLGRRAAITVVQGKHATLARLKQAAKGCHIVHFIGHGDVVDGQARLLLVNDRGGPDWCAVSDITQCLRDQDVRLVCLNGCRTAAIGAFASQFPAVVGMQFRISDEAAIAFAKGLYSEIVESGQLDRAVWQGRQEIFNKPEPRDRGEYLIPVLYMQSEDGQILPPRQPVRWVRWAFAAVLAVLIGLTGYQAYVASMTRQANEQAVAGLPLVHDVRLVAQSGGESAPLEYVPVPETGGVLHSGDNFQVHVQLNRDAYVQVLMLDSAGKLGCLFPGFHETRSMRALPAGRIHVFPGAELGFQLDAKTGSEMVLIVASETLLDGLEEQVHRLNAVPQVLGNDGELREGVLTCLRDRGYTVEARTFKHQ